MNTCLGCNVHITPKFETMSADDLNNFFNNLGSETNKDIVLDGSFMEFLPKPMINSMFLISTTSKEIINIVKCLVPKSTQGFDKISSKLIISTINQAANVLNLIFNKSFKQDIFPDNCKIARVVPIFKSGEVVIVKLLSNLNPTSFFKNFRKPYVHPAYLFPFI